MTQEIVSHGFVSAPPSTQDLGPDPTPGFGPLGRKEGGRDKTHTQAHTHTCIHTCTQAHTRAHTYTCDSHTQSHAGTCTRMHTPHAQMHTRPRHMYTRVHVTEPHDHRHIHVILRVHARRHTLTPRAASLGGSGPSCHFFSFSHPSRKTNKPNPLVGAASSLTWCFQGRPHGEGLCDKEKRASPLETQGLPWASRNPSSPRLSSRGSFHSGATGGLSVCLSVSEQFLTLPGWALAPAPGGATRLAGEAPGTQKARASVPSWAPDPTRRGGLGSWTGPGRVLSGQDTCPALLAPHWELARPDRGAVPAGPVAVSPARRQLLLPLLGGCAERPQAWESRKAGF